MAIDNDASDQSPLLRFISQYKFYLTAFILSLPIAGLVGGLYGFPAIFATFDYLWLATYVLTGGAGLALLQGMVNSIKNRFSQSEYQRLQDSENDEDEAGSQQRVDWSQYRYLITGFILSLPVFALIGGLYWFPELFVSFTNLWPAIYVVAGSASLALLQALVKAVGSYLEEEEVEFDVAVEYADLNLGKVSLLPDSKSEGNLDGTQTLEQPYRPCEKVGEVKEQKQDTVAPAQSPSSASSSSSSQQIALSALSTSPTTASSSATFDQALSSATNKLPSSHIPIIAIDSESYNHDFPDDDPYDSDLDIPSTNPSKFDEQEDLFPLNPSSVGNKLDQLAEIKQRSADKSIPNLKDFNPESSLLSESKQDDGLNTGGNFFSTIKDGVSYVGREVMGGFYQLGNGLTTVGSQVGQTVKQTTTKIVTSAVVTVEGAAGVLKDTLVDAVGQVFESEPEPAKLKDAETILGEIRASLGKFEDDQNYHHLFPLFQKLKINSLILLSYEYKNYEPAKALETNMQSIWFALNSLCGGDILRKNKEEICGIPREKIQRMMQELHNILDFASINVQLLSANCLKNFFEEVRASLKKFQGDQNFQHLLPLFSKYLENYEILKSYKNSQPAKVLEATMQAIWHDLDKICEALKNEQMKADRLKQNLGLIIGKLDECLDLAFSRVEQLVGETLAGKEGPPGSSWKLVMTALHGCEASLTIPFTVGDAKKLTDAERGTLILSPTSASVDGSSNGFLPGGRDQLVMMV